MVNFNLQYENRLKGDTNLYFRNLMLQKEGPTLLDTKVLNGIVQPKNPLKVNAIKKLKSWITADIIYSMKIDKLKKLLLGNNKQ